MALHFISLLPRTDLLCLSLPVGKVGAYIDNLKKGC